MRKNEKVIVYLDEVLFQALTRLIDREDTSYSKLIRKLVITELKGRGLLTDAMLAERAE